MLTKTERLFLQAVAASIRDQQVSWQGGVSAGEWREIAALALRHKVFPMVLEAVCNCNAFYSLSQKERKMYQKQAAMQVLVQTIRTQEYGNLLQYLEKEGLHPLTVKGILCRQLYPQPELRASADEDMLIRPEEWERYHRAMSAYGMCPLKDEKMLRKKRYPEEVAYRSRHSSLCVELHTVPFSEKQTVFRIWNLFFQNVQSQNRMADAGNFRVRTMEETDYLFYLICHMMKHFLYSGFGIRQVCDLMLFAENYGEKICWEKILRQCQEIHTVEFVTAVFGIAKETLGMHVKKTHIPEGFLAADIDTEPLLEDIVAAGIYGNADQCRIHSSTLTLRMITDAQKETQGMRSAWLHLLCPPFHELRERYPVLQRFPWMLPGVWILRLMHCGKETVAGKTSFRKHVSGVLQTGQERMALLDRYHMGPTEKTDGHIFRENKNSF